MTILSTATKKYTVAFSILALEVYCTLPGLPPIRSVILTQESRPSFHTSLFSNAFLKLVLGIQKLLDPISRAFDDTEQVFFPSLNICRKTVHISFVT